MFSDLLAANGGHPEMGTALKDTLLQTGFDNVRAGASFDFFGTKEDIEFVLWIHHLTGSILPMLCRPLPSSVLATQGAVRQDGAKS